jgi:hypothetical protein
MGKAAIGLSGKRIKQIAREILQGAPNGIHRRDLEALIHQKNLITKKNTIRANVSAFLGTQGKKLGRGTWTLKTPMRAAAANTPPHDPDQDEMGEAPPEIAQPNGDDEEVGDALGESDSTDIEVRSITLDDFIASVRKGEYQIPRFQREYVWGKTKVRSLLESICLRLPIGSIFVWKAGSGHSDFVRHLVPDIPAPKHDDAITFVLDGQQRITSLYYALRGLKVGNVNYRELCFDLKARALVQRKEDRSRFWSVATMWNMMPEDWKQVPQEYGHTFNRFWHVLHKYPVCVVEVKNKDTDQVIQIFGRLNQSGKRLTRFDLVAARTWTPEFDLRERSKKDISDELDANGFGEISPDTVTQVIALLQFGGSAGKQLIQLTPEHIKKWWGPIAKSLPLAAGWLRYVVGVRHVRLLPYEAFLILLSYAFASSGKTAFSQNQARWLQLWFWRASFGQRYGSHVSEAIGKDKLLLDKLMKDEEPTFDQPVRLSARDLIATKMTQSESAIRNAFLCLLAHRHPIDLLNNMQFEIGGPQLSDLKSPEKHHVFPRGFLETKAQESRVHALPNFCFVPGDLNRKISATGPSKYFGDLKARNSKFEEACERQLIPITKDSGIWTDDYDAFLEARAKLLLEEIERLCGISITIPGRERHDAIGRIEERLRDKIYAVLEKAHGPDYWNPQNIPQDVYRDVEERIRRDRETYGEEATRQYSTPRGKLNKCTPGQYWDIIRNRANWPYFKNWLKPEEDAKTMLRWFSNYRNPEQHFDRPLISREEVLRRGELAINWLGRKLGESAS